MSTIRTFREAAEWVRGASELGDPSEPVCVLLFRWELDVNTYLLNAGSRREDPQLVAGVVDEDLVLAFPWEYLEFPLRNGRPIVRDGIEIVMYGASAIVPGVWIVTPSLNVEDTIHGFVVLYDVPTPAPWELAEPKPFPARPQIWIPK